MMPQEINVEQFVREAYKELKDKQRLSPQRQREWARIRKLTIAQYGMDVWSAILQGAVKNGESKPKI